MAKPFTSYRFYLTDEPAPNTIEVYVDGLLIPRRTDRGSVNWHYDFANNAISFVSVATPEPGAHVQVRYATECL